MPVWTYACADALLEQRVWMEQGANTTYVQYRLLRGLEPAALDIKALVNYRDYHATTRADGWRMQVDVAPGGLVVTAFDGACQLRLLAEGATAEPAQEWYQGGPRERDGAYHQGTAWGWLLGPFALAHFKGYGDRDAALVFLEPLGRHLGAYGVGSLGEVFDGEPPFAPGGCQAQAWTVAETLRAWTDLTGGARRRPR